MEREEDRKLPAKSSSSRETTTPENQVVFDVTDDDVLSGRGKAMHIHEGNIRFRRLIAERIATAGNKDSRRDTALEIIRIVHERGGRFLKQRPDTSSSHSEGDAAGAWVVLGITSAVVKVKQALRDAYSASIPRSEKSYKRKSPTVVESSNLCRSQSSLRSSSTPLEDNASRSHHVPGVLTRQLEEQFRAASASSDAVAGCLVPFAGQQPSSISIADLAALEHRQLLLRNQPLLAQVQEQARLQQQQLDSRRYHLLLEEEERRRRGILAAAALQSATLANSFSSASSSLLPATATCAILTQQQPSRDLQEISRLLAAPAASTVPVRFRPLVPAAPRGLPNNTTTTTYGNDLPPQQNIATKNVASSHSKEHQEEPHQSTPRSANIRRNLNKSNDNPPPQESSSSSSDSDSDEKKDASAPPV